jgi:molybdopterin-guanine dinucleotide biosynthesis protein A
LNPPRQRTGVTGIVIGGGRSTRLGTSKPMIQLGGKLVLARVSDMLHHLCDELVFVARQGQNDYTPDTAIALQMHVVTDTEPYSGPLAAIHAGLKAAVTPLAFVIGADYPFLSRPLIQAMIAAAVSIGEGTEDSKPLLESVVARISGHLVPLHSVLVVADWVGVTERALAAGERSPARLIRDAVTSDIPRISVMTEDEVETFDPRLLSFFDIDTPEQLNVARRLLDPRRVTPRPDIRPGGL